MDYSKIILDNIRDIILVVRGDEIVFATPSVREFGYDVSEVINKKYYEFLSEFTELQKSLKDGDSFEIKALAKKKNGRAWIEAKCKKVGEILVVIARDVSREVSIETLLRAIVDVLKSAPAEIEEIEEILQKYFVNAEYSDETKELTLKNGEIIIPVRVGEELRGSLRIFIPDWFKISEEDFKLLEILGECVARNLIVLETRRIVLNSLVAIKAASESLALLVDRIRNPLAIINGLVEIKVGGDVYERVSEQVEEILNILRLLEKEWKKIDELAEDLLKRIDYNSTMLNSPSSYTA